MHEFSSEKIRSTAPVRFQFLPSPLLGIVNTWIPRDPLGYITLKLGTYHNPIYPHLTESYRSPFSGFASSGYKHAFCNPRIPVVGSPSPQCSICYRSALQQCHQSCCVFLFNRHRKSAVSLRSGLFLGLWSFFFRGILFIHI